MQGAQADAAAVAPKYVFFSGLFSGYELTSSVIADIKGRPLKAYKRGTVHGMVCYFRIQKRWKNTDG
jgi:hypothetical protein